MKYFIASLFFITGVINFIPIVGVLSDQHLSRLYLVDNLSVDVALLLRHRAILFGIVGGLLIYSAFQSSLRIHATLAGMVSMLSFVVLVFALKTSNPSLVKVAWIDIFAIVLLTVGYVLHLRYS